jgi:hypothetical protein
LNQLDALTQINLDDLVSAFGLRDYSAGARMLRRLFYSPARRFATHMAEFDREIGDCGLPEAARSVQRRYVKDVRVHNRERIPTGPILVVSNHPGMTDTTSIFAALGRADLKTVALPRPFLAALPNMSRQLLFVMDDGTSRMSLVREASRHLRECGAVLTFPAGNIEPDPDIDPEAAASLTGWNPSVGLFVRNAPETAIVPLVVRGVVWHKAARHPLLRLKRSPREKEKLAAALQLLSMLTSGIRPVTVHVQAGRPIYPSNRERSSARAIHEAVLVEMKTLIEQPLEGAGESIL